MKQRLNIHSILLLLLMVLSLLLCACGQDSAGDVAENELTEEIVHTTDSVGADNETTVIDSKAKIIRIITLNGETKDFESATDAISKQLSQVGGYVEKSNITGGESLYNNRKTEKRASYVLRVPADKLDIFLEQTEGLLNVTSSTETTTDVTLDYYDIESRLQTLKSKKSALEAMLASATTLDEIMKIQDSLYEVISDIESYQSRLNAYDSKVNYSTVNLEIVEVLEYTETETEDPTFIERVSNAFKKSWTNFGKFIQGFAVFIVWILPILLVVGTIAALILFIIRKKKNK